MVEEDKVSASRLGGRRFDSRSSHTQDFKIGSLVAALPDTGVCGLATGLVGAVSVCCAWEGYPSVLHLVSLCGSKFNNT